MGGLRGGLERMLRIYFLQQWFNLSDPALEEVLCDSAAMLGLCGHRPGMRTAAGRDHRCKFRHLLEERQLGGQMLIQVNG